MSEVADDINAEFYKIDAMRLANSGGYSDAPETWRKARGTEDASVAVAKSA